MGGGGGAGGHAWQEGCVVGGGVAGVCMAEGGHAWQVEGMCGRQGGMHGRGHAWLVGMHATKPPPMNRMTDRHV